MNSDFKNKIILLTLVHPDLLPPVYAIAQVLRDEGYCIEIISSSSTVKSSLDIGSNIIITDCGKYIGTSFSQRKNVRGKIKQAAIKQVAGKPIAIISFCAFSFLCSDSIHGSIPQMYIALEIANFKWNNFLKSPLTAWRNLKAIRKVDKADLIATPSVQRSAWLAGRANIEIMPFTIHNTAYKTDNEKRSELFRKIVPSNFVGKIIFIHTGSVNERLGVFDIVKAFDALQDNNTALIVTRVSDSAYSKEIINYIENSINKDRFFLLPNIPREEMLALQANAHIGISLVRETGDSINSKMIAPNKIGEYISNGLYLVGSNVEYMKQFKDKGIASLAKSMNWGDISHAMFEAVTKVSSPEVKNQTSHFFEAEFCMQQQLKPVIEFAKNTIK